jgi:hypothetical protein
MCASVKHKNLTYQDSINYCSSTIAEWLFDYLLLGYLVRVLQLRCLYIYKLKFFFCPHITNN